MDILPLGAEAERNDTVRSVRITHKQLFLMVVISHPTLTYRSLSF